MKLDLLNTAHHLSHAVGILRAIRNQGGVAELLYFGNDLALLVSIGDRALLLRVLQVDAPDDARPWFVRWQGQKATVRTIEDALALVQPDARSFDDIQLEAVRRTCAACQGEFLVAARVPPPDPFTCGSCRP